MKSRGVERQIHVSVDQYVPEPLSFIEQNFRIIITTASYSIGEE